MQLVLQEHISAQRTCNAMLALLNVALVILIKIVHLAKVLMFFFKEVVLKIVLLLHIYNKINAFNV
jgi:hypothetical protein